MFSLFKRILGRHDEPKPFSQPSAPFAEDIRQMRDEGVVFLPDSPVAAPVEAETNPVARMLAELRYLTDVEIAGRRAEDLPESYSNSMTELAAALDRKRSDMMAEVTELQRRIDEITMVRSAVAAGLNYINGSIERKGRARRDVPPALTDGATADQ